VGCRREPHDQKPRIRISEARNGSTPVGPINELFPLRSRNVFSIVDEPRASPTVNNLVSNVVEGFARRQF
jgi:hypothetical protein